MKLHCEVNALYIHYQARDLQAQQHLHIKIKARSLLLDEQKGLLSQQSVLKNLIREYKYAGCKNRATLFEEMRKVAVLRRKLLNVNLQCQLIQTKVDELTLSIEQTRKLIWKLHNKCNKFSGLLARLKAIQLNKSLSEEESELEEYLS